MVRWNLHRVKALIVYCKPRISLGVALVAGAQVSFDHIFLGPNGANSYLSDWVRYIVCQCHTQNV